MNGATSGERSATSSATTSGLSGCNIWTGYRRISLQGQTTPRVIGWTAKRAKRPGGEVLHQITEHYDSGKPFVLFATASLIGEGFDLPRLDTPVLSMPLSFKGRLIQYAGQLHRMRPGRCLDLQLP